MFLWNIFHSVACGCIMGDLLLSSESLSTLLHIISLLSFVENRACENKAKATEFQTYMLAIEVVYVNWAICSIHCCERWTLSRWLLSVTAWGNVVIVTLHKGLWQSYVFLTRWGTQTMFQYKIKRSNIILFPLPELHSSSIILLP